jgi:hypothetical protein
MNLVKRVPIPHQLLGLGRPANGKTARICLATKRTAKVMAEQGLWASAPYPSLGLSIRINLSKHTVSMDPT